MNKVYSLGHSNISIEEFINSLIDIDIKYLIDVRSDPTSSYVPHFNRDNLEKSLEKKQIQYFYCGRELGGRQEIQFDKYTYTSEYEEAIKNIVKIITLGKSAIMCSEKDYKNCHRKFISETLLKQGYDVIQIKFDKNKQIAQSNINRFGLVEDSKKQIIYTIGYTKKNLQDFVSLIKKHGISKIIDIRLKNNSQLAGFAKSEDLKYILENFLSVGYLHKPELSPTEEIFKKYKNDKNWDEYVISFTKLMEERNVHEIIDDIISDTNSICLLCSEDTADKCHRRLIAENYQQFNNSISVKHLTKKDLFN